LVLLFLVTVGLLVIYLIWVLVELVDFVFACLVLIIVLTFWGVGMINYLCAGLDWFRFLVNLGLVGVDIVGIVFVV